jgi:hypothetical protein
MILVFVDDYTTEFYSFKETCMEIYSFHATIHDLAIGGETKNTIEKIIRKNKNIKHVVFAFGQIDIVETYYTDIISNKGKITDSALLHDHTKKYVEWVSELPGKFKRLIIGPRPNMLTPDLVVPFLIQKKLITEVDANEYKNELDICLDDTKMSVRYYEMLYNLKRYVREYNFNHNLIYVNLYKTILDDELNIKQEYISNVNALSLRWDNIANIIISEFRKFDISISSTDIIDNLKEVEFEYMSINVET